MSVTWVNANLQNLKFWHSSKVLLAQVRYWVVFKIPKGEGSSWWNSIKSTVHTRKPWPSLLIFAHNSFVFSGTPIGNEVRPAPLQTTLRLGSSCSTRVGRTAVNEKTSPVDLWTLFGICVQVQVLGQFMATWASCWGGGGGCGRWRGIALVEHSESGVPAAKRTCCQQP